DVSKMEKIKINHPLQPNDEKGFMPYKRDERGVRPWALPGTPGLEHRIGGLEKQEVTGNVSYEPNNHHQKGTLRGEKIANIKPEGPDLIWTGREKGDVLVIGWGSTFGAIKAAVLDLQKRGIEASAAHVRYIHPMPARLGDLCKNFKHVLIPEMNLGQLRTIIRARFLIDAKGLNKVKGQPFTIEEIVDGVEAVLAGKEPEISAQELVEDIGGGG